MWDHRCLKRIDWRTIPILICLMIVSILVIAATTGDPHTTGWESLFPPHVMSQLRFFGLGWAAYFFVAGMDYTKLRQWAWVFYVITIILLCGLFFTAPIQNVQRWYRVPFIGFAFQPSECAKLVVVIILSAFLDAHARMVHTVRVALQAMIIVGVPFALILKQPDLGTSLILCPITLAIFYLAGIHKKIIFWMKMVGVSAVVFVNLMFLGVLPHDKLRPYATNVIKEYQYERLNPHTYHQKSAQTALGLGGWTGSGWHQSEFTGRQWLPAAHTDSVFAAFGEEFGVVGIFFMLLFFFGLLYFSFQVTAVAKDQFGRLLSAGITVYLAMHIIISMGMMSGYLPITGVPLILVTYGGSSILSTMTALGILQSIYSRRFMF